MTDGPETHESPGLTGDTDFADPGPGALPWTVRLICCGRPDGTAQLKTRGDAVVLRGQYLAAEGHQRAAIVTGPAGELEQPAAVVLAEYLEALGADRGLKVVVDECLVLLRGITAAHEWEISQAHEALDLAAKRAHTAEVLGAAAREVLDSVRTLADAIVRVAKFGVVAHPGDDAWSVLDFQSRQLLAALGPGDAQHGPQRHAGGPEPVLTAREPSGIALEPQRAAEGGAADA